MQSVFVVFMAFVSLICLFAVLVVLRDIIREGRSKKSANSENGKPQESEKPVTVSVPEKPVSETATTTVPVEVEIKPVVAKPVENAEVREESVAFSPKAVLTLDEKYGQLPKKYRSYYDQIVKHAKSIENAKQIKNTKYEEYKLGLTRLVRMVIKKGVVIAEFVLPNPDFKNYLNENKVSVTFSSSSLKILDENAVSYAKDSIDIAVKAYEEEREYKKELARIKRQQIRENKR